jgi:tetratricopeptide (TPR) repeat protein
MQVLLYRFLAVASIGFFAIAQPWAGAQLARAHSDNPEHIVRLGERVADQDLAARYRARQLLKRARFHRVRGEARQALADLELARELGLKARSARGERGLVYEILGENNRALSRLDRFLAKGAPTVTTLNARARLLAAAGRKRDALRDYASSLELAPDIVVFVARGKLLEELGDYDAAVACYREGIGHLGRAVLLEMALVRSELERGQSMAALRIIDDPRAPDRKGAAWSILRSRALQLGKRTDDASAELDRALTEAGRRVAIRDTAISRLDRARVHEAMGNAVAARADVEAALKLAPTLQLALEMKSRLATVGKNTGGEEEG